MKLNKHNLKPGDTYRQKDFVGDVSVIATSETYFKVQMKHVSGTDYFSVLNFVDFNNKMILGEITSLIRN